MWSQGIMQWTLDHKPQVACLHWAKKAGPVPPLDACVRREWRFSSVILRRCSQTRTRAMGNSQTLNSPSVHSSQTDHKSKSKDKPLILCYQHPGQELSQAAKPFTLFVPVSLSPKSERDVCFCFCLPYSLSSVFRQPYPFSWESIDRASGSWNRKWLGKYEENPRGNLRVSYADKVHTWNQ